MLNSDELHELYEGLQLNGVNKYDYVLTGESPVRRPGDCRSPAAGPQGVGEGGVQTPGLSRPAPQPRIGSLVKFTVKDLFPFTGVIRRDVLILELGKRDRGVFLSTSHSWPVPFM